jgi:glutathione S-transferase
VADCESRVDRRLFGGEWQLTVADLAVYPVLQWITSSIVTPTSLEPFPLLSSLLARVQNHPKVQGYYRKRDELLKSEQ